MGQIQTVAGADIHPLPDGVLRRKPRRRDDGPPAAAGSLAAAPAATVSSSACITRYIQSVSGCGGDVDCEFSAYAVYQLCLQDQYDTKDPLP